MFTRIHYSSHQLNYLSLDIYLSEFYSSSPCFGLFACPSVGPSVSLAISRISSQSLYVSINPLVCTSVQPFIGLSAGLTATLSAGLSVCLSVSQSVCLSVGQSVSRSVCLTRCRASLSTSQSTIRLCLSVDSTSSCVSVLLSRSLVPKYSA